MENKKWREQDGIIYFSVTSDGATGPEWIACLEKKGFSVSNYAKGVLLSKNFKPTSGVTTEIAVLKGDIFSDDERITKKIRAKASELQLSKPNAEVACLIRKNFSNKDIEAMGLIWIILMHEPIKDSGGDPTLLAVNRYGISPWLDTGCGGPDNRWGHGRGFAFVASYSSVA